MHPKALLVGFGLLVTVLVLGSAVQRVGDGREYLAMGLAMARLHAPALSPADVAAAEAELRRRNFDGLPLTTYPRLRDANGRQDFFHFWFYPALAVPGLWLAAMFGLPPNAGFVALNLVLFFGALWVVSRRMPWWVTAAVFCSPILWWIDKAHTEVFTFALLAAAFALLRDKPWWSAIAIGAAATQNLPIAALLPAFLLAHARRARLCDARFWLGASAGTLLALLHPLYYEWRWRVPTPQVFQGTHARLPSLQELGAVIWDPNIGLLPHAPFFALAVIAAAIVVVLDRRAAGPRATGGREEGPSFTAHAWLALLAAAIFLWSFSQTTNFNNGATCGMSRYATWLIPLALPLLDRAARTSSRQALTLVALASCAWSVVFFQPRLPERYCTPTRLASAIWTRWPSLDNPLPEIFSERLSGVEPGLVPVATRGCTKVLLMGGYWPLPCVPQRVPPECSAPAALCYANANGAAYRYVAVRAPVGYALQRKGTWVAGIDAAPTVKSIVDRVRWRELERVTPTAPGTARVQASNVAWTEALEAPGDLVVYARRPASGGRLVLQPARAMDGWLLDPSTGEELEKVSLRPSAQPMTIELGPRPAVVLVATAVR